MIILDLEEKKGILPSGGKCLCSARKNEINYGVGPLCISPASRNNVLFRTLQETLKYYCLEM